ncbi:MAG: peptide transporter [Cyanobacteria bacterium]|nr:peptide transporter [Cyanobacteriota bacterium]
MKSNLEVFELTVYRRETEQAAKHLQAILATLDSLSGMIDGRIHPQTQENNQLDAYFDHVIHRLAAAITSLFSDPAFQLSAQGFSELMRWQRWISAIFAASEFHCTDHILETFNLPQASGQPEYTLNLEDLPKFAFLYSPESQIPLNIDLLWEHYPEMAVSLAMVLLSPRFLGSEAGHHKRNLLLPWLTDKLNQLDRLESIPTQTLHDVYMHCSYATIQDRHAIKRSINRLVRQWLVEQRLEDLPSQALPLIGRDSKPVALVVLEWFGINHSIYRTHSKTIEAMRADFQVIGLGYGKCVDAQVRNIFDAFIEIPEVEMGQQLQQVRQMCQQHQVAVIYMVSIGMSPLNIFLSNLRLAPLQATSWGHPATSNSEFIDYYIAERDLVPDPSLFSEKILWLEPDEMPFRITETMANTMGKLPAEPTKNGLQIAICASTMKLNPSFLATLARIVQAVDVPVHFHFLVAGCIGIVYRQISKTVAIYLPGISTVYPQLSFDAYMQVIASCDLSLNPFPFGNCNGIVDVLLNGVLGVCMQGPHLFESIDQALYRRLGLPEWLIASDEPGYIEAAIRLISDQEQRQQLSAHFGSIESVQALHFGKDSQLSAKLLAKIS